MQSGNFQIDKEDFQSARWHRARFSIPEDFVCIVFYVTWWSCMFIVGVMWLAVCMYFGCEPFLQREKI